MEKVKIVDHRRVFNTEHWYLFYCPSCGKSLQRLTNDSKSICSCGKEIEWLSISDKGLAKMAELEKGNDLISGYTEYSHLDDLPTAGETKKVQIKEQQTIEDLAMIIRMLITKMKNNGMDCTLIDKAVDYLKKNDLSGKCYRRI